MQCKFLQNIPKKLHNLVQRSLFFIFSQSVWSIRTRVVCSCQKKLHAVRGNYAKGPVCIVFPTWGVLHSFLALGLCWGRAHDCNHCAPNYLTNPPSIQAFRCTVLLQCKAMQMQLIALQCTASRCNWFSICKATDDVQRDSAVMLECIEVWPPGA